jgi:hypothetical protein
MTDDTLKDRDCDHATLLSACRLLGYALAQSDVWLGAHVDLGRGYSGEVSLSEIRDGIKELAWELERRTEFVGDVFVEDPSSLERSIGLLVDGADLVREKAQPPDMDESFGD